jgi:outer membrane biosynthesis protein TonB
MPRRREPPRLKAAILTSLALHAAAIAFAIAYAPRERPEPRVQVYRVDIVSDAPTVAGEPPAEPPAAAEPEPEPEPVAEAEASPEAPTEPEPAPPPPEPRPAPEPPPPPRREPPREPARPPAARPPAQPAPPASRPAPPPAGRTPDPASRGGEGINIRSPGIDCPSPEYCNNITRQVRRYFRPPEGTAGSRGDVCFRIRRDGSVEDIEVQRLRGPVAFRFALMEAAEQAGNQRAFGALPPAFGADALPVCVEMSPETL